MLGPENLREVDEWVLTLLREGRITPGYARVRIGEEHGKEYTRAYVQQRLARLEEHEHVVNLYEQGLYELVSDPEEGGDE